MSKSDLNSDVALANQLLSNLLTSANQRLTPYLEEVSLTSGQVIHKSGESIAEVYFPQSTVFSVVINMSDGSLVLVSLVGKEGLVGLAAILGGYTFNTSSVVQISGTAWKLPTAVIRREFQKNKAVQQLLLLYTKTYLAHIAQIAACNSLHNIEHRLALFLLMVQDALGQKTLPLTQKSISIMLGVRRASVTETAILMQKKQIIQYSRGKITILDRTLLEAIACECYVQIKSEYQCLFSASLG
ncbi:MAG: Crp/Fnr family transcriptional regulator [Cyanobacteria bacterium P01_E01_bin.35]